VLWDNLPIDTVIASLLDPRTKFFDRIPKHEVNEALKIMAKVYFHWKIINSNIILHHLEVSSLDLEKQVDDSLKHGFSELFEERPKNRKTQWADELDRYRIEIRLDFGQDPLLWWKLNECRYPLLGKDNNFH
jgi:hypothetical protein